MVDLTLPPPLERHARALERAPVDRAWSRMVEGVAEEERGSERARRLGEILRKLETGDAVELLKAVGKSSLALEPAGVRTLFAFLEVKRPGVEVLRQLETLSSLERVALRLVAGRWSGPEEAEGGTAAYSILEVLEEGLRVGVIDVGVERLPRRPQALLALFAHVRAWFSAARTQLELENRLPEADIHYLTQLGMIEIHLLESRLSRLASRIDPYDMERIARLLPLLSRYDQDVDHMKSVVSRLVTYEPFYERLLTVEHAIGAEEMDRLEKKLKRVESTAGLARVVAALRENPLLDRRLAVLTSALHQVGVLRAHEAGEDPCDLHSILLWVLEADTGETPLRLCLEASLADVLWPTVEQWGLFRPGPCEFEIPYLEDRAGEFLGSDGTPRLPRSPEERAPQVLSLKDLVRSQLQNDAFILGILENGRATSLAGVVETVASQSRSLRVLDKICRTPSLHTGPANKNVPMVLLMNPSRIPLSYLRRFISVRFVSKVDLRHLARNSAGLRSEVLREIEQYLDTLKN